MGKVIKKKLNGMSWWMKTSLVLLLTLTSMVFMYEGWYKPKQAQAAIAVLQAWPAVATGTTAATPLSATYTASAGTDRLMVCAFTIEGTGAAAQTITATYGGKAFTPMGSTAALATRQHAWLGYIKDADLVSRSGDALSFSYSNGTADVFCATYTGVDQTTPVSGSNQNFNAASAAVTVPAISVTNGGVIITSLAGNANTQTPGTGFTESYDVSANGYSQHGSWKNVTATGTETPDAVWALNASTRWGAAIGAINPAAVAGGNLAIGPGTALTTANAAQGSINNTIDSFTMAMSAGTATVASLTVLGDANFTATNIPTNGVKVWRDTGSTIGSWDATDVLVSSASTAISGNASTVTITSEAAAVASVNYIVTVDLNGSATLANQFTATVSAATGTGIGTPVDTDTTGKTLTVTAGAILNITESTTEAASMSAPKGSTYVLDSFAMATTSGTSTVTTVTVTGNAAGFLATNIGTNGVHIYRDAGTIGTLDGADVQLSTLSPAIAANATTITLTTPETVTQTGNKYLVVVDLAAAAVTGNTITGTVSGVAQTGAVSVSDTDAASATLTVAAAQTLTIANSTAETAAANIQTGGSAALDTFQLSLNSGTGTVSTLTLTGSASFTTANISNAAVYTDNGVVGTYEAGTDILVPSTYSQTGTAGTITFTAPLAVSTTAVKYIVVVTASGSATLTNTFTGTITTAAGSGIGTPASTDTDTTLLTVVAGPVATLGTPPTSCGKCHGNPPVDSANSTTRAAGLFAGDHGKHTAAPISLSCASCHTNPTANDHSNGTIDMVTLRGVAGESYTQGSHPVSNAPTFGSCTTYCHSLGTSKTTNVTETRTTLSAPKATLTWATPNAAGNAGCSSCHGFPPDYANLATTWGPAKANSHSGTTHAAQLCTVCHNSVTQSAGVYTLTTGHADGNYDVAPTNITYTYVSTGGTCASTAVGCHAGSTATWGKADCLGCHNSATLGAPEAAKIVAAVTTRRDINAEFGNTANHVRSRGSAVTSQDCAVCHLEGNISDGTKNTTVSPNSSALTTVKTYHGNGIIELRNVDDAAGGIIKAQSFTSPATWTAGTNAFFVRFKRNLAATPESETTAYDASTTNTVFAVNSGIQIQHCLTCHDSGGAAVSFVPGGSASKPFGGAGLSPLNVASQLANTNRSYHPVIAKQNNGYAGSTVRMNAPWNGVNKTGTTTVYGPLITCWDCHASPTDVGTTITSTATAHGHAITAATGSVNSVELVGRNWATGAVATNTNTFCIVCHKGYNTNTTTNHGTGSAYSSGGSSSMSIWLRYGCLYCHGSSPNPATAVRTTRAADVHGYDTTYAGGAFTAGHGYAFIRSTILSPLHVVRNVGGTGYTATCGTANITITNGTTSCSNGMDTYTVGGVY